MVYETQAERGGRVGLVSEARNVGKFIAFSVAAGTAEKHLYEHGS